jgi:hypothetical protein
MRPASHRRYAELAEGIMAGPLDLHDGVSVLPAVRDRLPEASAVSCLAASGLIDRRPVSRGAGRLHARRLA